MGLTIIRLEDNGKTYFLEWSSIVDAPVTFGGTLDQLREYIGLEYGEAGLRELPDRLDRVVARGTSSLHHDSVDDQIRLNRAGEGETCLTKDQIIAHYVRGEPLATGRSWDEIDG